MRHLLWLVPASLVGLLGDRFNSSSPAPPRAASTTQLAPPPPLEAEPAVPPVPSCEERIASVLDTAGLPGSPALDAARGRILLYAKGEPLHFSERPGPSPDLPRAARSYRSMLHRARSPWSVLQRLSAVFSANAELARQVLLSDGYLYAEEPKLAFALSDLVSAQLLFNDRQIWVQRGERLLPAERTHAGSYVFAAGAERGERVRLMLFDRVGTGTPPPALHRDFRALRERLGFDRVRVVHETRDALVGELRYGSFWVRSLLIAQGARLELSCELAGTRVEQLARKRAEHGTRSRLLAPVRKAILAQVDEGLPFDEPLTEYGQQDGKLRPAWQSAYEEGRSFFELNGDRYFVFDREGRPRVPQVCIDFIYDTLERASGNWWRGRGHPPGRTPGKLDLAARVTLNLRRATSVVELAQSHPDWLELQVVPESERIPFKFGQRLAAYLTERADDFLPGDIVIIRGYAPWDKPWLPPVVHQHSFFVYESDPLSGMPIVLAGNPGQPVLQTWQFEAFRTPERSLHYRIRPRESWLASFLTTSNAEPSAPARLSIDAQLPGPRLDIPTPPGGQREKAR